MQPSQSKTELLGRLRRLEGIVAELSSQLEAENGTGPSAGLATTAPRDMGGRDTSHAKDCDDLYPQRSDITRWLGQLVVHGNESLYMENTLWTAICDEVRQIHHSLGAQTVFEVDSLDSFDGKLLASPPMGRVPFFWGHEVGGVENLQPLPSQIPFIWQVFVESVDTFIKVLHVPTMSKAIRESKGESPLRLTFLDHTVSKPS